MKVKIFTISLITLAAMMILSACSGQNPRSDASSDDESDLIVSGAESSDTDVSSPNEEDSQIEEEPTTVRIDADGGLRMRTGPGTDYDIIKVIPNNEYADIAEGEADPGWLYVSYDGDQGWVSKEFVIYEAKTALPQNSSESWVQVYYDYLATFEPVTYTSTMYGSTHTVAGRMVGNKKIACMQVEFRRFDGYDYPVLVCWDGSSIDADGNMGGAAFVPNIYPVENEKLTLIDSSDSKRQSLMVEGDFELKGKQEAEFSFKPENGGDPENIAKALAWLKTHQRDA